MIIVVNRFILWFTKLAPKGSLYDTFVSSFLKETQWKYPRYDNDNAKHIFVYLRETYGAGMDIAIMNQHHVYSEH